MRLYLCGDTASRHAFPKVAVVFRAMPLLFLLFVVPVCGGPITTTTTVTYGFAYKVFGDLSPTFDNVAQATAYENALVLYVPGLDGHSEATVTTATKMALLNTIGVTSSMVSNFHFMHKRRSGSSVDVYYEIEVPTCQSIPAALPRFVAKTSASELATVASTLKSQLAAELPSVTGASFTVGAMSVSSSFGTTTPMYGFAYKMSGELSPTFEDVAQATAYENALVLYVPGLGCHSEATVTTATKMALLNTIGVTSSMVSNFHFWYKRRSGSSVDVSYDVEVPTGQSVPAALPRFAAKTSASDLATVASTLQSQLAAELASVTGGTFTVVAMNASAPYRMDLTTTTTTLNSLALTTTTQGEAYVLHSRMTPWFGDVAQAMAYEGALVLDVRRLGVHSGATVTTATKLAILKAVGQGSSMMTNLKLTAKQRSGRSVDVDYEVRVPPTQSVPAALLRFAAKTSASDLATVASTLQSRLAAELANVTGGNFTVVAMSVSAPYRMDVTTTTTTSTSPLIIDGADRSTLGCLAGVILMARFVA